MENYTIENRVIQFMDIHNFSLAINAMTESPLAFLQQMYESLGDIIVAHGGEIIKYLGDGLLCVFPTGSENEAIKCSLESRRVFAGMVSARGLPPDTELEIGLSSGEVEVGILGHKSLRQKDMFGQVINQAAAIGHHRGIAITEQVYDKVKASFETRKLPERRVKWRERPLKVWEVVES